MPTYNNVKYLTLPQQVEKNRLDIATLENSIVDGAVGPQGAVGPRGPQGVQGNTGAQGIQGVNGTPVAGLSGNSSVDPTLNIHVINLQGFLTTLDSTKRFIIQSTSVLQGTVFGSLFLYKNNVLQTEKISSIDSFLIRQTPTGLRMVYYDENGEAISFFASETNSVKIATEASMPFSIYEILNGSTVGPAGAQGSTGATGAQGATGPAGAQGVQGIPGLKNMAFLADYTHEETFTPYAYRVMVQIVGGDYDGYTAIKETLVNGSTVKFGPYVTLVSIETNGGVIQCILQNGVTEIRVYKIDNIS